MPANPIDLARAAATDLGPDVLAAIIAPPADDSTRAFGISEAMALGGFLVQAASIALQLWQARQDRTLLVAALANSEELMKAYPRLDPEKRMSLIARVVKRLLPDFQTGPAAVDKRRWVADYIISRQPAHGEVQTRDFIGGATILVPFADQFWWAVYTPIGWVPSADDGPTLVRADVPKGFVTDLASVPGYLWAFLQKTGKYGNAAIYHDWLYWQQHCPRDVADRVFDLAMRDMGVDDLTRNLIWGGVRVFGGSYWEGNAAAKVRGEKRVLKRLPDKPTVTWEEWRKQPGVFE